MQNRLNIFIGIILVIGLVTFPAQAATEEEIEASIAAGVEWLVAQQNMTAGPYFGSWNAYYGQYAAGTGLALYKLCDRAYEFDMESPFDLAYEYHQNVIDGFDWIFNNLVPVDITPQDHTTGATGTIDDPDVNGNGIGIRANSAYHAYSTGIVLAAVASSGTFDRVISSANPLVDGRTFGAVAQDMVDFLAFAQVDPSAGYGGILEGGWDYFAVNNGTGGSGWKGDQSNSGYAVLGLGEAQYFGCTVPDWVKTELNWWINWVQDDVTGDEKDGGSWYSYPGDGINVNTLKTGNLLFEMALAGDTPDEPRVVDALDYLVRHWGDASGANLPPGWNGNPAQYQAMFCLMKGLEYMGIDTFDSIDWFDEFSTVIVAQQDMTVGPYYGSWRYSSGRGEPVIITEWALLTLQRVAPPPPLIAVDIDIKPLSCPNPLNPAGRGVLPVAILGTEEFDVTTIDPATVMLDRDFDDDLEGIYAVRWDYEDVATPVTDGEECECTTCGADGYMDLTLKFATQDVRTTLGDVSDGEVFPVFLRGNLLEEFNGTGIEGSDCIVIRFKGGDMSKPLAETDQIPDDFALYAVAPNPFNPSTTISYGLPEASSVEIVIYNMLGQKVNTLMSQYQAAGVHSLQWQPQHLPSGLYILSFTAGDFHQIVKVLFLK